MAAWLRNEGQREGTGAFAHVSREILMIFDSQLRVLAQAFTKLRGKGFPIQARGESDI